MVEAKIKCCLACAATSSEKTREPLKMTELPSSPWSEVSMDFQGPYPSGDYLLVVIDDYSRYPEIEIISSTSVKSVLPKLHSIFARHGVPQIVKTDNGSPFNATDFSNFAKYMGFQHKPVTPLWPEANGGVERFMRVLKKIMQSAHVEGKNWKQELYRAMLNYRATPHATTGISPAEALFGRKIRTRLPEPEVTVPNIDAELRHNDFERKTKMKLYADNKRHTRVSDLQVGDSVLVRQPKENKLTTPFNPQPLEVIQKKGSMITAGNSRRSITRNSSFFKRIPTPDQELSVETPELELDEFDDSTPTADTLDLTEESEAVPEVVPVTRATPPAATRSSTRVRQAPVRHKDYVRH